MPVMVLTASVYSETEQTNQKRFRDEEFFTSGSDIRSGIRREMN
jgi:hypothetical protein